MSKGSGSLQLISGVGRKGPACFLLDIGGRRLLLDLGEGPPPGAVPNLDAVGRVDAVVLSHGHKDHVGALSLLPKLGDPAVYATDSVARSLSSGITVRPLPTGGEADVLGIAVTTGRNGHAPGGIWLHFAAGDGFLYTGDYCTESLLYAYDPPTRSAATALIDCSYSDYQKPLDECWSTVASFAERGPLLLPVPANGRGPEIALASMRHGIEDIYVDDAMSKALHHLNDGDSISLHDGTRGDIARLAVTAKPIDGPRGVMLAASADGTSGATARLIPQFEHRPEVTILFTGYINPTTPAQRLTESGRAEAMRWNVHPRLSDTITLIRAIEAKTVVPAFCDRAKLPALAAALAPAHVTIDACLTI
jgi:Cft2 family RNA processing exonuclease